MPKGYWILGIKRHEQNNEIWKRLADEQQVEVEGWSDGYPKTDSGRDYLSWSTFSDVNGLFNGDGDWLWVLCERVIVS